MRNLNSAMLRFCEQVATGVGATRAYMAVHPKAKYTTATGAAADYLKRREVEAEILRLRALGQQTPGSPVMSLIEKRSFLARVVRAQIALLPRDSDLWQSVHETIHGTFCRLPNKIEAIIEDNRLSADDPLEQDSLVQLLSSIRK